ncbi:Ig-like domain-containing protein [Telluria beijingensis]|uniref:Ig-like domain-containing protein n=1 Tax=Telluria beijingensis TaxID=3068633 RepID=UPI0027960898|nr:Ig-like domain-containing protein [Massilia sp. REN29]
MTTFSAYDSKVNSFYLAFYGRPADPDGLKFWSQQLANNNGDFTAIVQFFAASEEAQVRFGSDSVIDRIAEIYQQLFNRAPDADGLAFWTGAIEQGHASLADVAISILNGAQGSDATLSQLRQKAVDAFTAQVEESGSEYTGYASIEAARILVRAVTPNATADDMDALVKAAVSFADTATKNPKVVEAIAVNTTLLALFDTTRGVKEPVQLAQALADTAKAAAGDPVTLESLLRGGGMDKVLKVMPAKATLQDVVKALAEGGLPAAVEVVYPSTPSTPPAPSYKLSFVSVTEGKEDAHGMTDTKPDNVTREKVVDVTFSYRGADLNSNQKYEYRVNGGDWIDGDQHIKVNTGTNTVVLSHIDLSLGQEALGPKSFGIMGVGPIGDLLSNIELRAVRADKTVIDSVQQQIVYDHYAAMPWVMVESGKVEHHFDEGYFTSNPKLIVEDLEPGAQVEYSLVTNQPNLVPVPHQTEWSGKQPYLSEDGEYTVAVRQIDVSGNISDARHFTFTLDREKPLAPTIALKTDSGTAGDDITNVNQIVIDHLEESTTSAWEYRIGEGEWIFGKRNDGSGKATLTLDDVLDGPVSVEVRQFDAAGNIGTASDVLSFVLDTTAPAGKFSLDGIEGPSSNDSNVTTLAKADVYFMFTGSVEEGDTFEYRLDDGTWTALDGAAFDSNSGILTLADVDFTTKDRNISVRVVDAAGNATTSKTMLIDSTFNDIPPVTITSVAPTFGLSGAKLALTPSTDSLKLADVTKLSLDIMNTGSAGNTPDYFDGTVKMVGNTLTLDSMPALNLYELSWEKGAFTTSKGEDVIAGSGLFVGGSVATVALPGFEIESKVLVTASGIEHSNEKRDNTAFIGQEGVDARIHSGDGHDLIADNGSKLTLAYDKLSMTAYDVVLGFDSAVGTATDIDKIELGSPISNRYDLNHDGELKWGFAASNTGKYTPAPGIEAVELTGLNSQSFAALMAGDTLKALNAALNVSNFTQNTGLLILATYEDQSILLSYVEKEDNDRIDQGDLAFIALFDQGTVDAGDIELVGSLIAPPG